MSKSCFCKIKCWFKRKFGGKQGSDCSTGQCPTDKKKVDSTKQD